MSRYREMCFAVMILLLLAAVCLNGYAQGKRETRLERFRGLATEKGMSSVEMPVPVVNYATVRSLDQAMETQSVLVLTLEDEASGPALSGDAIWTWYRFRIVKDLSATPIPDDVTPPTTISPEIPATILPLRPDEIVIRGEGGVLNVGGVEISSKPPFPAFAKNTTYLVFADMYSFSTRGIRSHFGQIELGPYGVFLVNAAGKIQPLLARYQNGAIARDIRDRYGNSLQQFEASARPQ